MEMRISQSIIMRISDFGESDLLVSFFTPDRGRLKGVAKGARRSRKRFANCLDLFCLVSLEYGTKSRGDLYPLNSCKLLDAYAGLRSDFYSLSLASYMVELVEILFPQHVIDNNIFELLKKYFTALDRGRGDDLLRAGFEARTMALGGYGINFERCCICGRTYTGSGRAVFMRNRGGIACLNCKKETSESPGMGPDAVKALGVMQSGLDNGLTSILPADGDIREIKAVLKLHMDYRIGRRLKSSKYLD